MPPVYFDDGVSFGKILQRDQREALVLDLERGRIDEVEPLPWQTCTCIGAWHDNTALFEKGGYKDARTVVHTLIDIVNKNGNLLLSVPLRGHGTPVTGQDVRFTTKGDVLYAFVMGAPAEDVRITSPGTQARLLDAPIASVALR